MKILIAAACVAVIAATVYFFVAQYQGRETADQKFERSLQAQRNVIDNLRRAQGLN